MRVRADASCGRQRQRFGAGVVCSSLCTSVWPGADPEAPGKLGLVVVCVVVVPELRPGADPDFPAVPDGSALPGDLAVPVPAVAGRPGAASEGPAVPSWPGAPPAGCAGPFCVGTGVALSRSPEPLRAGFRKTGRWPPRERTPGVSRWPIGALAAPGAPLARVPLTDFEAGAAGRSSATLGGRGAGSRSKRGGEDCGSTADTNGTIGAGNNPSPATTSPHSQATRAPATMRPVRVSRRRLRPLGSARTEAPSIWPPRPRRSMTLTPITCCNGAHPQ